MGRTLMLISAFVFFVFIHQNHAMQCLSQSGKPVDWFIVYKIPMLSNNINPNIRKGMGFYYMDQDNSKLQLSPTDISDTDNAIYNTLNQVYKNDTTMAYAMYNDQGPEDKGSGTHGHTKGIIGLDKSGGFWMVHSLPKFPQYWQKGYQWPENADRNGQTFLCISVSYPVDNLGMILMYTYPYIYDMSFPNVFTQDNPSLAGVVLSAGRTQEHVKTSPWYTVVKLSTTAGRVFHSFAKFTKFQRDLYDSLVSPELQEDLLVQSWIESEHSKGDMLPSNCSIPYKVYNIDTIAFPDYDITFSTSKDHSKWAISKTAGNWLCIGDINRQKPQFHRGGGQVCFQNSEAWGSFRDLVKNIQDC